MNLLKKVLKKLEGEISVIPSINVYDSVRYFKNKKYSNVFRENLKLIQTPQGFCFNSIYEAHKKNKESFHTDDSMILYELKNKIKLIKGEKINFKITTKEDYNIGKLIVKENNNMSDIRVGTGFDVHKFKKGRKLKLFGITIPFDKGLDGHSDADVGYHSIVDAILGGLCLGDIGNHFPPTDNKWKNKQSIFFMTHAKKLLKNEKFKINNLDVTLICEKPKVSQYQKRFIKSVAEALSIDSKKINIKGTTTEKLGFLGREEGIACQVSVTLSKMIKKFPLFFALGLELDSFPFFLERCIFSILPVIWFVKLNFSLEILILESYFTCLSMFLLKITLLNKKIKILNILFVMNI